MRVQDVTPEYIKALQAAGYKLSVNDIIAPRCRMSRPEFTNALKSTASKT